MKYIICFIFLYSPFTHSQQSYDKEERKGQLFFKVSSEYRITPFFRSVERSPINQFVELNEQNSGAALSYAFDWFVGKNISLGFSHSFRYDHITTGSIDIEGPNINVVADENGLLMDFHFYIQYHVKVFKESELYFQLGRSILNTGSSFNQVERFFDENDEFLGSVSGGENNNFGAFNLGLGWKKNKLEILGGIYTSNVTEYFAETNDFSIPYVRLSYNLGKL